MSSQKHQKCKDKGADAPFLMSNRITKVIAYDIIIEIKRGNKDER